MKATTYKVVELTIVTEDSLEECLNHWTALGWFLDGIHFVVRDGSRRPTMAFVTFIRESEETESNHG